MRYVEPRASKFDRAAFKVVKAGDYMPFSMSAVFVGLPSLVTGLVLSITVSVFFLALMVVGLAYVPFLVSWIKHTDDIGETYSTDTTLIEAMNLLDVVRGTVSEQVALPMVEKIYNHAKQGHHDYYGRCTGGFCKPRIAMLRKLGSYSSTSNEDLENASYYAEALKEIGK